MRHRYLIVAIKYATTLSNDVRWWVPDNNGVLIKTLDVCGRTKPGVSHNPQYENQTFDQFRLEEILFERWGAYKGPLVGSIVVVPSPIEWCLPKTADGHWYWLWDGDQYLHYRTYTVYESLTRDVADEYWDYLRGRFPPPMIVAVSLSFAWDMPSARTMLQELLLEQPVSFSSRVMIFSVDGKNLLAEDEALINTFANPPLLITVPYPTRGRDIEWQHAAATANHLQPRTVLLSMEGKFKNQHGLRPTRQRLFKIMLDEKLLGRNGKEKVDGWHDTDNKVSYYAICRDGVECDPGAISDQDVWERSKSSVFCLEPPGDTATRSHLQVAILSGCIPVLFDGELFPERDSGPRSHTYVVGDRVTVQWSGRSNFGYYEAVVTGIGVDTVDVMYVDDSVEETNVDASLLTPIVEAAPGSRLIENTSNTKEHAWPWRHTHATSLNYSEFAVVLQSSALVDGSIDLMTLLRNIAADKMRLQSMQLRLRSVMHLFTWDKSYPETAFNALEAEIQQHAKNLPVLVGHAVAAQYRPASELNGADVDVDNVHLLPHCTDSLDKPSHLFRAAFVDHRPRRFLKEGELSVVILAELPKGMQGRSIVACSASVDGAGAVVNGVARIEHLQLDSDVGYGWIHLKVPWLTHRQSFVHCILDKTKVPTNANILVKVARRRTGGGVCLEPDGIGATTTSHIVPGRKSKSIEVCVGVLREGEGFPIDGMLAAWIAHYKAGLGVSRVNLYVADPEMLATQPKWLANVDYNALAAAIASRWVRIIPWKPFDAAAKMLKATVDGKYIEVGDGRTFYLSQALAYNDCVYQSASQGSQALVVDIDDFVTALPSVAPTFDSYDALSFAWVQHNVTNAGKIRTKTQIAENVLKNPIRLQFWEHFTRNQEDWESAFEVLTTEDMQHGKCLYNSIAVLDVGVHTPEHCTIEPCRIKRLDPHQNFYTAHVRQD